MKALNCLILICLLVIGLNPITALAKSSKATSKAKPRVVQIKFAPSEKKSKTTAKPNRQIASVEPTKKIVKIDEFEGIVEGEELDEPLSPELEASVLSFRVKQDRAPASVDSDKINTNKKTDKEIKPKKMTNGEIKRIYEKFQSHQTKIVENEY